MCKQKHQDKLLTTTTHTNKTLLSLLSSDITIKGYKIPAGTPVQMNIYSVLSGKQYFEDPDTFKPERFLNKEGTQVVVPEAFIPFGYGKSKIHYN